MLSHKYEVEYNEIKELLITIADKARRDGLLSLEPYIEKLPSPLMQYGLRLVVDGVDEHLINDILENYINRLPEHDKILATAIKQGVIAIGRGDHPRLVATRIEAVVGPVLDVLDPDVEYRSLLDDLRPPAISHNVLDSKVIDACIILPEDKIGRMSFRTDPIKDVKVAGILREQPTSFLAHMICILQDEISAELLVNMAQDRMRLLLDEILNLSSSDSNKNVSSDTMEELRKYISEMDMSPTEKIKRILMLLPENKLNEAASYLKETHPDILEVIARGTLSFSELANFPDLAIQTMLKETPTKTLTIALSAAQEDVKNKILKNVSHRAKEILLEDMNLLSPLQEKQIIEAQTEILWIANNLLQDGLISIK